jgi:hypothetical protein
VDSQGAWMISKERERQVTAEGWTAEHDDQHPKGTMARAAACYALSAAGMGVRAWGMWPWDIDSWKPKTDSGTDGRLSDLVRAGALIAAEIDRLLREKSHG